VIWLVEERFKPVGGALLRRFRDAGKAIEHNRDRFEVETISDHPWTYFRCLLRRGGRLAHVVDPRRCPTRRPNESMELSGDRDFPQVVDMAFTEREIAIPPFRNPKPCLDPGV